MSHDFPFLDPRVEQVFQGFPEPHRKKLLQLRRLIFETADETPGVGTLVETLKWGEPSYVTAASKNGSTVRLGVPKDMDGYCAVYFICTTRLVEIFKEEYGGVFEYGGERCLLFRTAARIPQKALKECLTMAMTYHLWKTSFRR